jgi:hypothetical protein
MVPQLLATLQDGVLKQAALVPCIATEWCTFGAGFAEFGGNLPGTDLKPDDTSGTRA